MTTETLRAIARSCSPWQWALRAAWLVAFFGFAALVTVAAVAPHVHVPVWLWAVLLLLALVGE